MKSFVPSKVNAAPAVAEPVIAKSYVASSQSLLFNVTIAEYEPELVGKKLIEKTAKLPEATGEAGLIALTLNELALAPLNEILVILKGASPEF